MARAALRKERQRAQWHVVCHFLEHFVERLIIAAATHVGFECRSDAFGNPCTDEGTADLFDRRISVEWTWCFGRRQRMS